MGEDRNDAIRDVVALLPYKIIDTYNNDIYNNGSIMDFISNGNRTELKPHIEKMGK